MCVCVCVCVFVSFTTTNQTRDGEMDVVGLEEWVAGTGTLYARVRWVRFLIQRQTIQTLWILSVHLGTCIY